MRQVYLDLHGTLPTLAETQSFLADAAPDKRAALVDRLLAHPRFARNMQYVLDAMWMERRPKKHIEPTEWREYLRTSLAANKPLHKLAAEILGADGDAKGVRPAVRFYLDRDADPNAVTRDVARLFFGRDLQCAQCHDHPLVDDYTQAEYYGLFATLTRGVLFTDKQSLPFYAEKADGEASYKSVFTGEAGESVPPCLPGEEPIEEVIPAKAEEYVVAPADGVRGVPKQSRRRLLAEAVASGHSRQFNRNLANRLWAHLFGRGLIQPLDLDHSENPPSHPELLELLTAGLAAQQFDLRAFLRELVLSRAYQRTSDATLVPTPAVAELEAALAAAEAEATASEAAAKEAAAAVQAVVERRSAASDAVHKQLGLLATARRAAADATGAREKAVLEAAQTRTELEAQRPVAAALEAAAVAGQAAAAKLAQDEALAKAAAEFRARADALSHKVGELDGQLKTREQAAAEATAKEPPALAQVEPAVAALAAARQAADEQRPPSAEAEQKLDAARGVAQRQASRRDHARLQLAYRRAADEVARSQQALIPFDQERANLQTQLDQQQAALAAVQNQAAQRKQAADEANAAVAEARSELAEDEALAAEVAAAAQQAAKVAAKFADDLGLRHAGEQLARKQAEFAATVSTRAAAAQERSTALEARQAELAQSQQEVATAEAALAASQVRLQGIDSQIATARQKVVAAETEAQSRFVELSDFWAVHLALGPLKAIPPEPLAWSTMQALGVVSSNQAAVEAELDKPAAAQPMPAAADAQQPQAPTPPPPPADRAKLVEAKVHERLQGPVQEFVSAFGTSPGAPPQDFQATVQQALFVENGGSLTSWLAAGGETLTARLAAIEAPDRLAEELYLTVLVRRPKPDELQLVEQHLASRTQDRAAAIQELIWALLSSSEFRFNH